MSDTAPSDRNVTNEDPVVAEEGNDEVWLLEPEEELNKFLVS